MDLRAMAMKEYFSFPKSRSWRLTITLFKYHIQNTHKRLLTPLQRNSHCIIQPQLYIYIYRERGEQRRAITLKLAQQKRYYVSSWASMIYLQSFSEIIGQTSLSNLSRATGEGEMQIWIQIRNWSLLCSSILADLQVNKLRCTNNK